MLCDIEIILREKSLYGRARRDTILNGRLIRMGEVALLLKTGDGFYEIAFIKIYEVISNSDAETRVLQGIEKYKTILTEKAYIPKASTGFSFNDSDWKFERVEFGKYEWYLRRAGERGFPENATEV